MLLNITDLKAQIDFIMKQDSENYESYIEELGTFQIPVDSFQETSGGGTMVILKSNLYDSSPSTTNQRPHDEVYETPRVRSTDPYPDCHDGVAASRRLRKNDTNSPVLSDIADLSLSTTFDGTLAIGDAV